MADTDSSTIEKPAVPAAWLEGFDPRCPIAMSDALPRYLRQVDAIANAIEDLEDTSACWRELGEVLRYKTADMQSWFDLWDAAREAENERRRAANGGDDVDRLVARLNGEADASALEALGNDVCALAQARLTPGDAQWMALAFRTAAEGDVAKAARVIANVRQNVRRANAADGPVTRQGDDGERPFVVRLESGSGGEDAAGFLRHAAKVIGVLTEYAHDVALEPSQHAGTLGEPVYRDASSAINQLIDLADRLARAKRHTEVTR